MRSYVPPRKKWKSMFSIWRKFSPQLELRFSGRLWSVDTLQNFDQKILMKLRQCNSTDTLFHPVSSSSDNKPPLD